MEVARYVCYEKGQEVKGVILRFPSTIVYWWHDSAVTLEGTIIHKSGLITGGRSTHSSNKKWDEKDVAGEVIFLIIWLRSWRLSVI
jgi:structural maintenance of chromosome 1